MSHASLSRQTENDVTNSSRVSGLSTDSHPQAAVSTPHMAHTNRLPIIIHALTDITFILHLVDDVTHHVTFMTAPGAVTWSGVGWFIALEKHARELFPRHSFSFILDCGKNPGAAMSALHSGVTEIAFQGEPLLASKLQDIATATGAILHLETLPALHLSSEPDPLRACREWLKRAA